MSETAATVRKHWFLSTTPETVSETVYPSLPMSAPSNFGGIRRHPSENSAFHAVDRGSNPLGDAILRYNEEHQRPLWLGVLCIFGEFRFPNVQLRPLASTIFVGIFVGTEQRMPRRYPHL